MLFTDVSVADVIKRADEEMYRNKKELKKMLKALLDRKHMFIEEIITGKLDGIKEEHETCEEIWNLLVVLNTYISPSGLRSFFTGKNDYETPQADKDAADDKISKLNLMQKMLIALDHTMQDIGELMDWRGEYIESKANNYKEAFKILKKWGWSFEEEEKAMIDGTHEFYKKEGKA